jgi:hypothetical protein
MRLNKTIFAGIVILFSIALYMLAATGIAESQENYRAILVAHGSDDSAWNVKVKELHSIIQTDKSLELAFIHYDNIDSLQNAIQRLDAVEAILLIHLSPSSYTTRHEALKPQPQPAAPSGKATKSPWLHSKLAPPFTSSEIPITVAPAIDDYHLIVDKLRGYAKRLASDDSKTYSLVLVGYGAINELENIAYVRQLEKIGERIRGRRFKEVVGMTLRNHSADLIREQAIINFRRTVKRLSDDVTGKVIIIPYVLWQGSFHNDLLSYLGGVVDKKKIAICNKNLLSNARFELKQWVEDVIKRGMEQPMLEPVSRTWTHMDTIKGDPVGTNQYGICEN